MKLNAEQKQAFLNLITGRDVFINLPTGYGKSPIYQLAPSIVEEMSHLDGKIRIAIILVISPLVSLMKDQVQYLQQKGIKALFIDGGQCKMGWLAYIIRFVTFVHLVFSVRSLDLFCHFTRPFLSLHSCL